MSADLSMLDLFRLEAEGQGEALVSGLLGLEQNHGAAEHLDEAPLLGAAYHAALS